MDKSALILKKAIELAKQSSWESFSLVELADSMNLSLADISIHFRSKDDMAEALFDRADQNALNISTNQSFRQLSVDEKLVECIMVWFSSFDEVKPLIKEILAYKVEPGHFHLQAHGITRVSRTVQWFLSASERNYQGLKRVADEVALTSAYLTSFSFYLLDKSARNSNTRSVLKLLIKQINRGHSAASVCFSMFSQNSRNR